MLTRKLHLGESPFLLSMEVRLHFWEKHLPRGPAIYPQHFFVILRSSAKELQIKSSLVLKIQIIIPALNETDFLRSYIFSM